jgi:hypothetical protein
MADLEMIKGGDFLFLSLPFFFLSFFLLLSSQKWRGRGSRGAPLFFGVYPVLHLPLSTWDGPVREGST